MKKVLCTLAALATFFLFSSVALAATQYEYGDVGDITIYDDWDINSTSSFITGSSDEISGALLKDGLSISDSYFTGVGGASAKLDYPQKAPFSFNGVRVGLISNSFTVSKGGIYRVSGKIMNTALSSSSKPKISKYAVSDGTVLASKFWADGYSLCFDIVFRAETSRTFVVTFYIDCSSTYLFDDIDLISLSSQSISNISEHQKSIEEWLEAIYGALVGRTGEGGGTSNPELDESVSQAGQLQGSLDDFENSIQGDFESSFNDLNLGGFKLPVGILSAMSWIGTTWTGFFNGMGELQYIILFPCFVGLALLLIGRAGMAMHIVSMKKDRSKKGGES